MDKLNPKTNGASKDIVEENIEKLRDIFPDVFTEGSDENGPRWKLDFQALQGILGDYTEGQPERYSFNWNGKGRARLISQTSSTGTLRPCPEESVHWEETKNLFIEGDNLEVLKLLQKSYHKKVKMIYIDPPYNTGKEFIYPDNFQDNLDTYLRYTGQVDGGGLKVSTNAETSGRFHTNWLNMMYPRLKLARNLLRNDGSIFVSIDDNEIANLRKLCDEVFGEDNFIGMISRATGTRMGTGSRGIARELDYILVYSKEHSHFLQKLPMMEKELALYDQEDERGKYLTRSLRRTGGENRREDRPSMYYPVISPDGDKIYPIAPQGFESRWVCGADTYEKLVKNGFIEWKKVNKNGKLQWQVYQKHYLQEGRKETSDLWNREEGNKKATRDLNSLFDGHKLFDHPKPVGLMKKLLQLGTTHNEGHIVLDFFAGSGTMGHAVIDQNICDGGNRSYILVQLPESCDESTNAYRLGYKTISELGKERIRRAGQKLRDKNPGHKVDFGFRVFKLDSSNIVPWDADFDTLERSLFSAVENIKSDRSEEDILYEILLKYGLDLTLPIEKRKIAGKTVFTIGAGALVICLDNDITLETINGIAALKEELKPEVMRVVLKDTGFQDDVVKTNAVQILKQADIDDVKSL